MKLLFLSFNFPGPLFTLASWLAKRGHEVLFASSRSPALQMTAHGGIKRVVLKRFSALPNKETCLDLLENALRAARYAEASFAAIKKSGFYPEIVFSSSSGGQALAIPAIFPQAMWLNFLEPPRGDISSIGGLPAFGMQMLMAKKNLFFYPSQKALIPEILQSAASHFTPVVDCAWFSPQGRSRDPRLAVFFNLKSGRIVADYLQASPENTAIWIASASQAKKCQTEFSSGFGNRCGFLQEGDLEELRQTFRRARVAFFEYPGELPLQAMACACAVFASREICADDLPAGIMRCPALGLALSDLLKARRTLRGYGKHCRDIVESQHAADKLLPAWFEKICQESPADTASQNPTNSLSISGQQ